MSGVVGCWLTSPQRFHAAAGNLGAALEMLKHRGPDDCGMWHNPSRTVVLGHRRLAVVDPSPGGHQPMPFIQDSGEDELIALCDGTICNDAELRTELETHGYEFYSDSDTEVLPAAWRKWGTDCLDRLRGPFAFALWDGQQRRLLLARDAIGQRPLYYTVNSAGLYFASELNALRRLIPHEHLAIDRDAVDAYLCFGSTVGRRTIYRNVFELPPATAAVYRSPDEMTELRYWRIDRQAQQKIRFRQAVAQTDDVLREAVACGLRSDVPVAVHLTGSIESGTIAAIAAECSGQPPVTLAVGDGESAAMAAAMAGHLGTEHHAVPYQPDVAGQLPAIARQYGEPLADARAVQSWFVAEALAYHSTVVLDDAGGDELFCGLRRHVAARKSHVFGRLFGGPVGSRLARIALKVMPAPRAAGSRYALWHLLLRSLSTAGLERTLLLSSRGFRRGERRSLYADGFDPLSPADHLGDELSLLERLRPLEAMAACDVESTLPDLQLVMRDISGMACSIESRSPFLDRRTIEWAASIPLRTRLRGNRTKPLLRGLATRYLPRNLVDATQPHNAIPVRQWLEGELRELRDDLILNRGGLMGELFNREALEWLLSRRGERSLTSPHRSQLVWSLLMLALWDQECWSNRQAAPARYDQQKAAA